MKTIIFLLLVLSLLISSVFAQSPQTITMSNGTTTTCSAILYDSGGSQPNIGMSGCIEQGTYSNNEDYTHTICSGTLQSIEVTFEELDIVSPGDYLEIYDGPDITDPILAQLTQGSAPPQYISSGTCLTFVFHSGDNGTDAISGCDDGGNWVATVGCTDIYYMDDPSQEYTCNAKLVDNGGIQGFYSEGVVEVKTFCSIGYNSCVRINFTMLDLGTGDQIEIFNGSTAIGSPLYTIASGDPIPPYGVLSDNDNCLTIKFSSDNDGNMGAGFLANVFCPATCEAMPSCQGNDQPDNQCLNATPICNIEGVCGNTGLSYDAINHLGEDWNTIQGLMDDFCGSIENNSWLSFVANESTATLNVWTSNCVNNQGLQIQVYSSTDCIDFTPHSNCMSAGTPTDFTIIANNLIIGATYYIMIDGFAGDICDFLISASSGISLEGEISQDQTICHGDPVILSVNGLDTASTTYFWSAVPPDSSLNGVEISQALINVSPLDTTVYTCVVSGPSPNPLCSPVSATYQTTVNVLDTMHSYCIPDIDGWISATGSTSVICLGDTVGFEVYGDIVNTIFKNDFNDGTPGINWHSTTSTTFTNPCGTGPDSTYLWMGNPSPAIRDLTSNYLNVSNGGDIKFHLRYAVQAYNTPCEGPDEPDEGIQLQYNNSGSGWVILNGMQPGQYGYFNPANGIQESTYNTANTPSATGPTPFTSWNQYTFTIPPAAWSPSTSFRWIQLASTTLDHDHWGLDDILITSSAPNAVINWTSDPPGYYATGAFPPADTPQVNTCYIATISATVEGIPVEYSDTICVEIAETNAAFSAEIINDYQVNFTDSSLDYSSVIWDFGDSTTSTEVNPEHIYTDIDVYEVQLIVSDTNGCVDTAYATIDLINGTVGYYVGLKDVVSIGNFKIYPNPTKGLLYIEFEKTDLSTNNLNIEIQNIKGQRIYSKRFDNISSSFIEEIDLSKYPQGIYFLKSICNETINVRKIIIQ